jgi:hypothetical protein
VTWVPRRGDVDGAAQGSQAIGYALQPSSPRGIGLVEALAVILDGEYQVLAVGAQRHAGRRCLGVLDVCSASRTQKYTAASVFCEYLPTLALWLPDITILLSAACMPLMALF